jgi:hypothetical protein
MKAIEQDAARFDLVTRAMREWKKRFPLFQRRQRLIVSDPPKRQNDFQPRKMCQP